MGGMKPHKGILSPIGMNNMQLTTWLGRLTKMECRPLPFLGNSTEMGSRGNEAGNGLLEASFGLRIIRFMNEGESFQIHKDGEISHGIDGFELHKV